MKMHPFGRLSPVDVVMRRLLEAAVPVRATERLPLAVALGRVAAEAWRAPRPVPEFHRATWDGYAIRSRDVRAARPERPVTLRIVGEVYAEQRRHRRLAQGEAVAIATGGAVPPGADTVVIYEETRSVPGGIVVERPVPPGDRIAAPGDDFPQGLGLVRAGDLLDPARLGALAATGRSSVRVYRRPTVALLSNGNELVAPGRPLGRGQIFEVNNVTLSTVVAAGGGVATSLPPVRDDPRLIERAIRSALRAHDLVLVTGGSSVGEHDYLPMIFPRVGRLLFHGVAVRPGKPTLAARCGDRLLLGLPGHPTSCLSNGLWMVLPLLRKISRLPGPGWIELPVGLDERLGPASATLTTVVPLHVEDGRARPTFKDSSAITSLVGANAFLLRPPGSKAIARGRTVSARLLPPPLGMPAGP